ncbi:LysR family transcriptional regulator [Alicycliphilus denitrificans]|uniref:LysR family transcriptional regulator n=1 Tax=Alicycliphilus denitrificans TaxID=179636 RepID=UPI000AC00CAB|nr:LysR family transcriptional regulator [Alicycliphilus denitrificans]MBN9572446.1 LysR family transcriptional regulator [Alicycliphilus denitrificans]BCN37792.1 LysR family transcriptional regulator [Alicycliphilus denitrificans]
MMTFKQLEAVYWVTRLGSFSQAAAKLHTTQSAISKRVQELESLFSVELFDRTQRTSRLTEKGEEMYLVAKRLLEQRDEAAAQFTSSQEVVRRLRIGVTELTAMTWLPRLVELVRTHHPKVILEPDVDMSVMLRDKLLANEVDVIFVPDACGDERFTMKRLGSVENAWMCKPHLFDGFKIRRLHDLSSHTFLTQGDKSGTGVIYNEWLDAVNMHPTNIIVCNSLLAIIGMTVSGLGFSYLPRESLEPLIQADYLQVLKVTPPLPKMNYVAAYKSEQRSTLISSIVLLAQECCDFSRVLQKS